MRFLIATRDAYHTFVPYHNFRHVVDVLQAVFYFLLQLGALPFYPPGAKQRKERSGSAETEKSSENVDSNEEKRAAIEAEEREEKQREDLEREELEKLHKESEEAEDSEEATEGEGSTSKEEEGRSPAKKVKLNEKDSTSGPKTNPEVVEDTEAAPDPRPSTKVPKPKSPLTAIIGPFDALSLLIAAVGHDIGHPGVNNAFLISLNTPLAQVYNDRSVLESYHSAAFCQVLRRFWPSVFSWTEMRQLLISSILATDMGLHFGYMKKLSGLQEKLHAEEGTRGWSGRTMQESRALICGLLIKCADISNVVCSLTSLLSLD